MAQTAAHISWGAIVGGVLLTLPGSYLSLYQVLSNSVGDIFDRAIVAYSSLELPNWLLLPGILIAVREGHLIVTSSVRS